MPFLNPFKKYDVDHFRDLVWVPLSQAPPRHPSVVAENKRRDSVRRASLAESERTAVTADTNNDASVLEKGTGDPKRVTSAGSSHGDDGAQTGFTIEQLREEVEADIAASGHDSAYDRKSKVINKAIQDIGMGRYVNCLCFSISLRLTRLFVTLYFPEYDLPRIWHPWLANTAYIRYQWELFALCASTQVTHRQRLLTLCRASDGSPTTYGYKAWP